MRLEHTRWSHTPLLNFLFSGMEKVNMQFNCVNLTLSLTYVLTNLNNGIT